MFVVTVATIVMVMSLCRSNLAVSFSINYLLEDIATGRYCFGK